MSEIVAVLVVPAEGDPGGLLASGRMGAEPPRAVQSIAPIDAGTWREDDRGSWDQCATHHAIPLWWDGRLCEEGWDRARRVYGGRLASTVPAAGEEILAYHSPARPRDAADLGHALVGANLASCVVLLARVDGRLVEIP